MDIPINKAWYSRAWFPGFFTSSHRIYDQCFGEQLPNNDLFSLLLHYRPFLLRLPNWENDMLEILKDRERNVIRLDVKHFSPEELTVKVNDDFIEIHGKHDERQDEHGIVAREFYRKYKISDGDDLESITSSLSSDGILTISTPRYQRGFLGHICFTCGEKPPAQK